jgi:hypothetical protein
VIEVILLLVAVALPVLGIVFIRRKTRKEVTNAQEVNWTEFEEEHGEAEAKDGTPG